MTLLTFAADRQDAAETLLLGASHAAIDCYRLRAGHCVFAGAYSGMQTYHCRGQQMGYTD